MKYSDLVENDPTPRMMRTPMAGRYIGAPHLLFLMEKFGWLKASVQKNRLKLWDRRLLDVCCDRLTAGEFPA